MKIHEYNEMMAYLTRPSYVSGGRVGFKPGGAVELSRRGTPKVKAALLRSPLLMR